MCIPPVVIIFGLVVVASIETRAAQRRALKQLFGPQYDRVDDESDSRLAAERELRDRERRHAELELRPLSDGSRARYAADWERIQARFVDSPNDAVREADDLVTRLVAERGDPTGAYDEQAAHLAGEPGRARADAAGTRGETPAGAPADRSDEPARVDAADPSDAAAQARADEAARADDAARAEDRAVTEEERDLDTRTRQARADRRRAEEA